MPYALAFGVSMTVVGAAAMDYDVLLCEECLPDALDNHPKPRHLMTKLETFKNIHKVAGLKSSLGCG